MWSASIRETRMETRLIFVDEAFKVFFNASQYYPSYYLRHRMEYTNVSPLNYPNKEDEVNF